MTCGLIAHLMLCPQMKGRLGDDGRASELQSRPRSAPQQESTHAQNGWKPRCSSGGEHAHDSADISGAPSHVTQIRLAALLAGFVYASGSAPSTPHELSLEQQYLQHLHLQQQHEQQWRPQQPPPQPPPPQPSVFAGAAGPRDRGALSKLLRVLQDSADVRADVRPSSLPDSRSFKPSHRSFPRACRCMQTPL